MPNIVYIATSLDGYIADKNGGLDWLHSTPNPDQVDFGWAEFIDSIDALIMGRTTFETVCGFGGDWPYPRPVFVLSNTMTGIPADYREKASVVNGPLPALVHSLNAQGYKRLYIDGGQTIQSFLKDDLIDELIITQMPVLLGGGSPLFGELASAMPLEHLGTQVHLNAMVQSHYRRKR